MYFKTKIITTFFLLFFYRFSFSQNYLNINCDYNSTEVTNTFKNLYLDDSLILLSGQYNLSNRIGLYIEKRRLNGFFIENFSIESDSLSYFSGNGNSLIKSNNNYYTAGTVVTSTNYLRSFLVKFDSNLDTIFTKSFDVQFTAGGSRFTKILIRADRLYFLGDAQFFDTVSNLQYTRGFFTKTDTLGNIIWQQSIGNSNSNFLLNGLTSNLDGSFYIYGSINQTQSYRDFYLIKLDSLGNQIWQRTWGDIYHDGILDIMEMSDGKLLVCGYVSEDFFGLQKYVAYLALLNSDGSQRIWEKRLLKDISVKPDLNKIFKNYNGSYDIWGEEVNNTKDITRPLLMTFSANFDSLDVKYYSYWNDPGAQNYLRDIVRMPDNGYMACGFGWDDNHGEDGWLLRIDSNGCANVNCTPLAIQDSENETEEFRIYPNPANDKLAIQCKMASLNPLESTCKVLDATGREVLWINKLQQNQCLDISELSVGLYVLRVQTSSGRLFTNKFLVSR